MFHHSRWMFVTGFLAFVFIGSGCVTTPVSIMSPEEAANSLTLANGSHVMVRPTVLGVGGTLVGWFGGEEEVRDVMIVEWVSGERVALSWTIATDVETEASKQEKAEYDALYAQSPVGLEIPEPPEPTYEQEIVEGTLSSHVLASADTLMLPSAWPIGEGGVVESSLIWLARNHFDELVNTRSTTVSLGLFDESLMKVEAVTDEVESFMDSVSSFITPFLPSSSEESGEEETGVTEETALESNSLSRLEANPKWGDYTLLVDGVKTTVQVVEAKNAFASYKILANPENPIILKIQLTPLSQGNLELLSRDGIVQGFGGYEITQINQKTSE